MGQHLQAAASALAVRLTAEAVQLALRGLAAALAAKMARMTCVSLVLVAPWRGHSRAQAACAAALVGRLLVIGATGHPVALGSEASNPALQVQAMPMAQAV